MTGSSLCRRGGAERRAAAAVALGLLLAAVAGCGGTARAPRSDFIPFTAEQKASLEAQVSHAYRIQEGDILKVHFAYERDLNQDDVVVLSDGSVGLAGVDRVQLAGLTMTEADSALTTAYGREYKEPALSVMVQETQGRRVYVLGQIRNPGFYRVPLGGMDVVSAVAIAGGFTDDAARDGTLIVRVTPNGYQFQEVNLKELGAASFAPFAAVTLQPYDIVYVPRSRVGDFAYFAKSVLVGLSYVTGMAYDIYNISHGFTGRY